MYVDIQKRESSHFHDIVDQTVSFVWKSLLSPSEGLEIDKPISIN